MFWEERKWEPRKENYPQGELGTALWKMAHTTPQIAPAKCSRVAQLFLSSYQLTDAAECSPAPHF